MNIRRIATTFTTGGVISLLAVGALGTGSAQAALCLEAGPDGPRTVPCPIELSAVESAVAGNAAFDRLLDSLADIALPAGPTDGDGQDESPEPEMCELVLADGRVAEIPCRMEPIGDIVFNPNPDTDEPPAEESPAAPEEGGEVADHSMTPADEPAADEPAIDEAADDEPITEQPNTNEPAIEARPIDELATDIAVSEATEMVDTVVSGGALPRTGATTMGVTLGLALMGLGGGTFAKIAATRRHR
jgi:hypothetical protein